MMRKLLVILGIPIDDLNMTEALDRLEQFILTGRKTGKWHQVATVNADFVVKAQSDPELRMLLQESDMATADGMPLVWGAHLLGVPLEGRVAGADMVPELATRAAEKGYSMYLLGAAPGIGETAAQILKENNPGLNIVGVVSPPYGSILDIDRAVIEDIKKAKPDILLVALGNPKQEKWIGMYGNEVQVPVMIGIGGTLDFIAGTMKRAPMWMQKIGMEWFFRLAQEPRRLWRRYFVDMAVFGSFFLREWWDLQRKQSKTATPLLLPKSDVVMIDNTVVISPHGRLTRNNVAAFMEKAQNALTQTPYLIINLSKTSFLDSSAIGALVGLTKQARDADGKLWLATVPEPIQNTLSLMRLDRFFEFHVDIQAGLKAKHSRVEGQAEIEELKGQWSVIKMPRRLDAMTAPDMSTKCSSILAENPHLVLDFSETSFLASAGLAELARLSRQANEMKGELRLSNCSKDVKRVIEMVRFDKIFTLFNDVATATV